MNTLTAIREAVARVLSGLRPPTPDPEQPIIDYLSDCARPKGDPKRRHHFYGRGERRGDYCLHCGGAR